MRRIQYCTIILMFFAFPLEVLAESYLKFGLFPYVSPVRLVEHHKAFIDYLEQHSGQKIQLVTSPDFTTFLERTRQSEFDIVLTAPHFGRLAERRYDYQRVAMTRHNVQGVYLVDKDSDIESIADIEGKTITIAAPTSIIYRLAEQQLRDEYGLEDGKNIDIVSTRTHNNAMYAVIKSESDAAVTGINLYKGLLKREGAVVKKIGETREVPGFMLMARAGLPTESLSRLRQAALSFGEDPASDTYIFKGYQEIDDNTMEALDPFITDLR
ncbi:MAG: phosphate/phosphite/phosphonate ABC transporter substrate-binding protein [Gammaproteobacteria bacterium]|nr:phosphate/phosphite/phosphonate ABC transporter substrate-binding protein [Gammaproteobacteria bacterium]